MSKKVIAVVGATGHQGGAVVRAILSDPTSQFAVRAITRNTDSEQAKELKKMGAEVVYGDLDHVDSMKVAFRGAYGAFCITKYVEGLAPDRERAQGENQAIAAQSAGLKHVIWSTLEDSREVVPVSDRRIPTVWGKYKVPEYDGKAEADEKFKSLGVPTTFLITSMYWDKLLNGRDNLKKGQNGNVMLNLFADYKVPGIGTEDIGKCVNAIFNKPTEYIGKRMGIAGEHLTGNEMAAVLTSVLNREVFYEASDISNTRKEMQNMALYWDVANEAICRIRDPVATQSLCPEVQPFAKWAESHKSEFLQTI